MGLNVLWCWDQFCGGDSGIFSECVFVLFLLFQPIFILFACADGEVSRLEFHLLTLVSVDLCRVLSDDPNRKIEAVRVEELFH